MCTYNICFYGEIRIISALFISGHTIVVGYYGFRLDVQVSVHASVRTLFQDDNLSKRQWIFTKLDMCIDNMKIWFGLLMGKFCVLTELSAQDIFLSLDNIKGF